MSFICCGVLLLVSESEESTTNPGEEGGETCDDIIWLFFSYTNTIKMGVPEHHE